MDTEHGIAIFTVSNILILKITIDLENPPARGFRYGRWLGILPAAYVLFIALVAKSQRRWERLLLGGVCHGYSTLDSTNKVYSGKV